MPYSITTVKLVFGGTLVAGEEWQCGLNYGAAASSTTPAQAALNAFSAAANGRLAAIFGTTPMNSLLSTGAAITRVRAYLYPAGATTAVLVADGGAINVVGAGSQVQANQIALVCSLRSADPSRKGRGRFYLPALGATVSAGLFASPGASNVAGNMATLLSNLNIDANTSMTGYRLLAGTSGFAATRVVVDNVLDTQRRRRDSVRPTAMINGVITSPAT